LLDPGRGAFAFAEILSGDNDMFAHVAYLATFAVGFGAAVWGAVLWTNRRLGWPKVRVFGDAIHYGRGNCGDWLAAPYQAASWFPPITLILIRVLQGLALSGEYGGAAVYVAEHVPDKKCGYYTSFLSDHRDAWIVCVADRDFAHTAEQEQRCVQRVGMANSLPGFDHFW